MYVAIGFLLLDYSKAAHLASRLATTRRTFRRKCADRADMNRTARPIPDSQRSLGKHALLFEGRIKDLDERSGRFEMTNPVGDNFWIRFNPRFYAKIRTPSRGQFLKLAVAIMPAGLRGDDPEGQILRTPRDDVYVDR